MKAATQFRAINFGFPIIRVTVADRRPHLHRGLYKQTPNLATECLCIVCLSGLTAEELCCGPITDHGDRIDDRDGARLFA